MTAKPFALPDGQPALAQTAGYICYDEAFVYVAFQREEPDPAGIKANANSIQEIWADDTVAVFLQPDPDKVLYYQYAVNPHGVIFDQKVDGGLRLYGLDHAWQVAAGSDENGWTVELKIPFQSLGLAEQMGRKWAINFCRIRAADKEMSSWAPVKAWNAFADFGVGRGILLFKPDANQYRCQGHT